MSRRWLLGVLAVVGAFVPRAAVPEPSPGLALWCVDAAGALKDRLVTRGEATMRAEIEALFSQVDVPVRFLDAPPERRRTDGGESAIVVVLIDGSPQRWGLPAGTLGAVMGREGPLDGVYVFARPVKRLLGMKTPRTPGAFHALGLAVARVAAHEIVHALAPGTPHTDGGLMRSELTRASLVGPRLEISRATIAALASR